MEKRLRTRYDEDETAQGSAYPSKVANLLSDPELRRLGIAQLQEYGDGSTIIVEGALDRSLFLIIDGTARVLERVEIEDHRHIQPGLCDLGPGDFFGELCLFEPAPRSASVVAINTCRLLVFDPVALTGFFSSKPEIGYLVLKELFCVLGNRLRQADQRLNSLFAWGLKAHGIDRHL